ncbi:hypothetical protein WDW86_04850, partial [Bdellovibrionota bacterium FG-2]
YKILESQEVGKTKSVCSSEKKSDGGEVNGLIRLPLSLIINSKKHTSYLQPCCVPQGAMPTPIVSISFKSVVPIHKRDWGISIRLSQPSNTSINHHTSRK